MGVAVLDESGFLQDAGALAHYLATLPPVRHAVPPPTGPSETPPAPYLTVVVPGR